MHQRGDLLIGAIFVLFYAADRFNTPETNRSSTTALRYHLAALCYLFVGMVLYLGLAYAPERLAEANEDFVFFSKFTKDLPTETLAALLLTVLLPKIPILAEMDEWIREHLQAMAAIPHEARRLAAELRKSQFTVAADLREEVSARLLNAGFRPEDILFEEGPTLKHLWTKISALMTQLEDWEADRKYVGFLSRFSADFDHLKARYRQLTPKALHCMRLLRAVAPEGASRSDELVLQFESDLTEQGSDLLNGLYSFISRGLLQCGTTYGARATKLATLGFERRIPNPPGRLTLDHLMTLFGIIGLVLLVGFSFLGRAENVPFSELFERAVLIATLYNVAVFCAVYPRERWRFARREPGGIRPASFYFVAGSMAAAVSLAVNFGFQLAIYRHLSLAWKHFQFSYPWALSSFTVAFLVAFMIDDQPTAKLPSRRLRYVEGLLAAGTLVLASLVIYSWIDSLTRGSDLTSQEHRPELARILIQSAFIGFVLGYLIPTWCREAPRGDMPVLEVELSGSDEAVQTGA